MDENTKSEEESEVQQNVVDTVVDTEDAAHIVTFGSVEQVNATTTSNEVDAIKEKSEGKDKGKVRYSQIATVTDAAATEITPTEVAIIEVAAPEADVTGVTTEKDEQKLVEYNDELKQESQEPEKDVSIISVIEKRTSLERYEEEKQKKYTQLTKQEPEEIDQNKEILFGEELDIDRLENYIFNINLTEDFLSSEEESENIVVEDTDGLAFTNFLEEFHTDMPEMENVEEDEKEKEKEKKKYAEPQSVGSDQGVFVDALTGKELTDSEEERKDESESTDQDEEAEEEDLWSSFDLPHIEEESVVEVKQEMNFEEEILKKFLFGQVEDSEEDKVDPNALLKEKERIIILETTIDFIDRLIQFTVMKSNYIEPRQLLRNNINKLKLMQVISENYRKYVTEKKMHILLRRKTVDFARRKKITRYLKVETVEKSVLDKAKLKENLLQLQELLNEEHSSKAAVSIKLNKLYQDLHEIEAKVRTKINDWENFAMATIANGRSERLQKDVAIQLRKQALLRDQISKIRFQFIVKLHNFEAITRKLNKLETLGPNLRMQQFMSLQTEVIAIGKKVEERNLDLMKIRHRFNCDLHIKGHMRETKLMLVKEYRRKYEEHTTLIGIQQILRDKVYCATVAREKMRKNLKDIHFMGGLLHKPTLMHEFDETLVKVNEAREEVGRLRFLLASVSGKITRTEINLGKYESDR